MQFSLEYIPAIMLTGMVYLFVLAGLWKNQIKQVYSRRTRREKVLTVGVLILSVVAMLFVASRAEGMLPVMGHYTGTVYTMLLWFLNGSVEILAMAVYFVCVIPTMVVSAAIIDEISQRKVMFAVPFYYYLLCFMVEGLFLVPLGTPVTGWFLLLLLATAIYCKVKAHFEGTNKKKKVLSMLLVAGIFTVLFVERAVPIALLCEYAALLAANTGAALVINRASVLKKKIWYAVTLVCFVILFFIGRLF